MIFLTRRERMLVAFVLSAFVTGVGVQHWRAMQAMKPLVSQTQENRP